MSQLQLTPLPPAPSRAARFGNKPKLAVVGLVILSALAFAATQASGEAGPSLRTAVATTRGVSKTLDEVGTVEPVSAAAVAFPVAGTVATVPVTKGATVTRGQILATLDTADLERAVHAAEAALAQAKVTLADAIAGNQAAAAADTDDAATKKDGATAAARQAVLEAQQQVDARLSDAQATYESAMAVCDGVTSETVASCQSALSDVLRAQQATAEAQQLLSDASKAYDDAIEASASAGSDNGNRSPQASSSTSSAADLAAMQKDIDAATAALAVAHQSVSAATIVSPIDGTVESVGLAVGDAVTAGATDAVIKVVGPNGFEVTTIVAVEKLANIKLGQKATVRADGSDKTQQGEVVAIGAPRSSNGATSYPVSIGVDDSDALRNGSVASVSIVTGSTSTGVAIPTSAVHTESGQSTVTVVNGSDVKVANVTLGVVGKTWTQIRSGLRAGQVVVLADLNAALPDSATTSSNGKNGGNAEVVSIPGGATFVGPPPNFKP